MRLGVPANTPLAAIRLELDAPPEGIAIRSVSPAGEAIEIALKTDAAKVKPGMEGNLIVKVFLQRPSPPAEDKAKKPPRRVPLGVLPAIPFRIVPK